MNASTKVLLVENLLTDCYLLLQEVGNLKINLAVELQAARDDRKAQHKELAEFMTDLKNTLDEIRAKHIVQAQLLDLIPQGPNDEPDKKTNLQTNRH